MRLIDADILENLIHQTFEDDDVFFPENVISLMDEIPTVDAVPVVRCKDCAYYENCLDTYMIPADCCPQGKRKEETKC